MFRTEYKTVEIRFWCCGNPKHHHKTEAIAAACVEKAGRPKRKNTEWTDDLKRRVFLHVLHGGSWSGAAAIAGISPERARQVVHKMTRQMMHPSRLDEAYPPHTSYYIDEMRAHRDFWARRLDKFLPLDAP